MEKLNEQEVEKVVGGITEDEALKAALKHAGIAKEAVDFVKKVQLDYEHGRKIYEVKFYNGGFEYEYDVDYETGKILKFEKDWD